MKLRSLYNDIVSRLSSMGVAEQRLVKGDITKAINDAIRVMRVQFVQSGRGEKFSVSETVTPTTKDANIPFLYSVALTQDVMGSLSLGRTVLNVTVTVDADELADTTAGYSTGEQVIKDNKLYKAVSSVSSSVNSYDRTFVEQNVKTFLPNNGMTYYAGEVVYDLKTDTYWECISEYENTSNDSIAQVPDFQQLYWKQIGDAHVDADLVPFERLFGLKLANNFSQSHPISIKNSTVYAMFGDITYYITYVPEWQEVTDFDADVDILEEMISPVKIRAIQILSSKLGVEIELEQMKQEDE